MTSAYDYGRSFAAAAADGDDDDDDDDSDDCLALTLPAITADRPTY